MIDLRAIIIKEVPIAIFISNPANKTNAGIIKKPPPAPTKPVTTPTTRPSVKTKMELFFKEKFFGFFSLFFCLIIMVAARIINAEKTNIIIKSLVMSMPKSSWFGIVGSK